jgi:nucleoside-specific outer membrane channel protein Tsx
MRTHCNLLAVAALATSGSVASAADWNDTSVGVRFGSTFKEPSISKDIAKTIFNFTYVSGDKLGTNLVVGDLLKSNSADPASNGGGGATEFYGLYQRTLSINALRGTKDAYGPFRDLGLVARIDLGTKNDAFAASPVKVRLGVSADIPVEAGFWNVGIQAHKKRDHNGIVGNHVTFKWAPVLTTAWELRVAGIAMFGGYLDFIGPMGKDGFGGDTKAQTNLYAKVMFDVGGATSGFKAGVGLDYYKNKYGTNGSTPFGATQTTALLLTEYHF